MGTIFLNRFYWPEEPATAQLLTDLAEGLAADGENVAVVTSHPGHSAVPREEIRHGVRIIRVGSTRIAHAGLLGKAMDFATFFFGALWRLSLNTKRGDTVVALTDPPLIGIGASLVGALRGAHVFHWVQDIYPELAMELAGQQWLRLVRPWRDLAWRRAAGCVTLGSDMAAVLTLAGVPPDRIHLVPNWAPLALTPPAADATTALRAEWGLVGKFVVVYSGNLGRVHDLNPVLAVASALRDNPHIAFVFIGRGAQRDPLQAEARALGLENVHFRPSQPRALLSVSLAMADVHLVTIRAGCERYVFPSKLYGIAAIGRPVIFIGPRDSEVARLIVDRGFGHAFDRKDSPAIVTTLMALALDPEACARLSAAALRFAKANGGAATAVSRWRSMLRFTAGAC